MAENNNKRGTIALIAAIIAILLALGSFGFGTPGPRGDIGEQGTVGTGEPGPIGNDGNSAYDIWINIGNNGTFEDFINFLKGEKGDRGEIGPSGSGGPRGPKGDKGEDGKDYIPNELPIVTINDINGTYVHCPANGCKHKYTFTINVNVDDPEDDNMHITFYWKEAEVDPWTKDTMYIGVDGNYTSDETFLYWVYQGEKTLYWLVETWDGSDIGLDYYNYTIVPPTI